MDINECIVGEMFNGDFCMYYFVCFLLFCLWLLVVVWLRFLELWVLLVLLGDGFGCCLMVSRVVWVLVVLVVRGVWVGRVCVFFFGIGFLEYGVFLV